MVYTDNQLEAAKNLQVVYGDVVLGVHGADFHYLFSYQTGGPESLVIAGQEWLYRTPKPTFWRATTDNDRGNQFSYKSSMWLGADLFIKTENVEVEMDGETVGDYLAPANNQMQGPVSAEEIKITYTYRTATQPAAMVKVSYLVNKTGRLQVNVHYCGQPGLPELPVFGLRFIMPRKAVRYIYEGLSGETYPDRMAGGRPGRYQIEGLPVTPYLVPQDCGVHMATKALAVMMKDEKALCFKMTEKPFAFSCLPYTAGELENATHQEELPPPRRTVVSILGAVRGVGGIDSWGADVEAAYHIEGEKDIQYSFYIEKG